MGERFARQTAVAVTSCAPAPMLLARASQPSSGLRPESPSSKGRVALSWASVISPVTKAPPPTTRLPSGQSALAALVAPKGRAVLSVRTRDPFGPQTAQTSVSPGEAVEL